MVSAFDLPGQTCFGFRESLFGLEISGRISRPSDWALAPRAGVRGDGTLAE
jgi:hypothetical protein